MQMVASIIFGLVLFGALALIATMLRAAGVRLMAVLGGEELEDARTPRCVTVVSPAIQRRAAARPHPQQTAAA